MNILSKTSVETKTLGHLNNNYKGFTFENLDVMTDCNRVTEIRFHVKKTYPFDTKLATIKSEMTVFSSKVDIETVGQIVIGTAKSKISADRVLERNTYLS